MSRLQEIELQAKKVNTMVDLTGAFVGIASMRISQIKNQVLQSQDYFSELWNIYSKLRVDNIFRFGRSQSSEEIIDRTLFVVITAEGGLSGDIDQKLIDWMIKQYDPKEVDIIVIGHHGVIQLAQKGIKIKRYFKMPTKDQNINVTPIINEVSKYRNTKAFYQTYVSLMVQDIKSIELNAAVKAIGDSVEASDGIISEDTYIFEPSTFAVIDHLETSMMQIALSQIILDSKLAQYASRFRAMSSANDKAKESSEEYRQLFNHTKRKLSDERLREILSSLCRVGSRA